MQQPIKYLREAAIIRTLRVFLPHENQHQSGRAVLENTLAYKCVSLVKESVIFSYIKEILLVL